MARRTYYLETRVVLLVLSLTILIILTLMLALLYRQDRITSPLFLLLIVSATLIVGFVSYYTLYLPY